MGQTLTHGIYLPDEGERNCYSGLAANWGILDGAVGTIAEHTAALAGKAPAVHTHTVSQITDFPAYGNAAGTICEGNDSRLSDARTPVAHTHTKSDVTDLLNSNFVPSANNSYDLGSSTLKWKTINGVNPGALSIPDKNNKADIASKFTDLTGGNNFYIPPVDGFVSINADTEVYCAVVSSTHNTVFWRQSAVATTTGYASVTIPVRAGLHLQAKIKSTGAIYAEFFPCLGNV